METPDGNTSGRCKPCGVLYSWKPGPRKRLHRAFCPHCNRRLDQTTAANIKAGNARLIIQDPTFEVSS